MALSITTDYVTDKLSPKPYLVRIADAGFTHIHWGHHWGSDFIYSKWEIDQIKKWLKDFGLRLLDLHASASMEVMTKNANFSSEKEFLAKAFETGSVFAKMLSRERNRMSE